MKKILNRKLRVGIIGLGVGKKHISALNGHPDCDIKALCDFCDDKLSDAGKLCPSAKLTNEAEEILDDPDIDLISIASYDNYHFDQIIKCIESGKHIFVEKPICLYREEAVQIKRILNENPHIRISSNMNLRTCPRFIDARDMVISGQMGNIFYLEGDYLWGRSHKLTEGWRKDMPFYSIILGAAVHIIDILIWITGKKPVEIKGYGSAIALAGAGFKHNDFAVILMKFDNGMVAKVSAQGGCVHPHFHRVNVYGTRKTFIHDELGGKIIEFSPNGAEVEEIKSAYPAKEEKGMVIKSFIDSIINSENECIVPHDDIFTTMSVCFAAEEAIQEGKTVRVSYM